MGLSAARNTTTGPPANGAGAGRGKGTGTVELPCVGMIPPSLIDYVLSRNLADGVVVAGCAERSAYHRLGVAWTKERISGARDPYLRARVPRERLATIWASRTERRRFSKELADFAARVAVLPPKRPAALGKSAAAAAVGAARSEEEEEAVS